VKLILLKNLVSLLVKQSFMSLEINDSENLSLISKNSETMAKTPEQHQKTFDLLKGPLILYTILAAGYVASLPTKWIWFSWHPLTMIISFVLLASNAALLKKIGGYNNTKLHGMLMGAAIALSLFGWYVIYTNKEASGKKHLTTYHGQIGCGVLLGYIGLGLFGSVALDPQWGQFKTNKTFRAIHKFAGRVMTALAWVVCVLGFATMQKELWKQAVFGVPLLIAGYFVLL
jgi:hypothetical protein